MRIYGIRSGKNNFSKHMARSIMYNSSKNRCNTKKKAKDEGFTPATIIILIVDFILTFIVFGSTIMIGDLGAIIALIFGLFLFMIPSAMIVMLIAIPIALICGIFKKNDKPDTKDSETK